MLENWKAGCSRPEQGNYNITLHCKLKSNSLKKSLKGKGKTQDFLLRCF